MFLGYFFLLVWVAQTACGMNIRTYIVQLYVSKTLSSATWSERGPYQLTVSSTFYSLTFFAHVYLSDHRILVIDLISPDSYFHQLVEPLNHYCLDSTQASCMKHLPVLGKVWEGSQWRHLGDPSSALSDESWISHMRDTHHEGTGTHTGRCDKKCPQRSLTRMKRSTKNVCLLTEPPEEFWL